MLDLQEIEVEETIKETVWILDPAVDLAATNVKEWFETGEGVVLKPKSEASVIRYQSLDDRQQKEAGAQAYDLNEVARANIEKVDRHALAGECARFGLLSISGTTKAGVKIDTLLKRQRYHGVNGLNDRSMGILSGIKCAMEEDLADVDTEGMPALINLQDWIGGLVAVHTFRPRG